MSEDLRAKIIASKDLKDLVPVEVPEWGCTVYIKHLPFAEESAFLALCAKSVDLAKKESESDAAAFNLSLIPQMVSLTLCDDRGELLFPGKEGIAELEKKSFEVLRKLQSAAMKLNGGLSDVEAKVEEVAKNSEPAPSESSTA